MSMQVATIGGEGTQSGGKALHTGLWVVQGLLVFAFGMAGFGKLTAPIDELSRNMGWVTALPEGLVRFIGASELAGALGLLLPSVTRVKPWLTPLAGLGLATVMLLASLFHLSRGEFPAIAANLVLGSLAAFVAWGRFRKSPIAPRA